MKYSIIKGNLFQAQFEGGFIFMFKIEQTLTSLEVAEMIGKRHDNLLADIREYIKEFSLLNFQEREYFQESIYKSRGKEYPCYKITKKGCEFVAHKLTGIKGTEFTAKYIDRFHNMEEAIKEFSEQTEKQEKEVSFKEVIEVISLIAADLGVNNISKLIMYKEACKDYHVPTNFLPSYIDSGDREKKSATELLEQFQCDIKVRKFNELMIEAGYLEERERNTSNRKVYPTGKKPFKVLTEKGRKYGENLTSEKNSKETQPLYYVDAFLELYNLVMQRVR